MVLAPPGDGRLGPVHELGFRRHDGVHLCLVTKVIPFVFPWGGKDMILLDIHRKVVVALVRLLVSRLAWMVLMTSRRLRLRGSKELLSVLLQLSHETALTRGVGRFPAWGAVGFARLVKRSIDGVIALLCNNPKIWRIEINGFY
jgi:hypothetical protein